MAQDFAGNLCDSVCLAVHDYLTLEGVQNKKILVRLYPRNGAIHNLISH